MDSIKFTASAVKKDILTLYLLLTITYNESAEHAYTNSFSPI